MAQETKTGKDLNPRERPRNVFFWWTLSLLLLIWYLLGLWPRAQSLLGLSRADSERQHLPRPYRRRHHRGLLQRANPMASGEDASDTEGKRRAGRRPFGRAACCPLSGIFDNFPRHSR